MHNGIFIENYKGYNIYYKGGLFFCWEFNDKEIYFGFKHLSELKKYINDL